MTCDMISSWTTDARETTPYWNVQSAISRARQVDERVGELAAYFQGHHLGYAVDVRFHRNLRVYDLDLDHRWSSATGLLHRHRQRAHGRLGIWIERDLALVDAADLVGEVEAPSRVPLHREPEEAALHA